MEIGKIGGNYKTGKKRGAVEGGGSLYSVFFYFFRRFYFLVVLGVEPAKGNNGARMGPSLAGLLYSIIWSFLEQSGLGAFPSFCSMLSFCEISKASNAEPG